MQTQSDYVLGEFPRIKGFALFEQFSGHHARSQGPGQGVGAGVVALARVGMLTLSLSFEVEVMRRFWLYVGGQFRGELIEFDSPDAYSLAMAQAIRMVGTTSATVEIWEITNA